MALSLSCAPAQQLPTTEVTTVTNTLLISGTFGRFADAVAISSDQFGNVYVVDRTTPSIVKFSPMGDSLGVISGFGRDHYQFDQPADVDARLSNFIFVSDYANHRIERYTKNFAYSASVERQQDDPEQLRFGYPTRLAVDDIGNIYFLDSENKRVVRTNSALQVDRIIGAYTNATNSSGALVNPTALAVDGQENLIVYDIAKRSLVRFDNLGNLQKEKQMASFTSAFQFRNLDARGDTIFALVTVKSEPQLWLYHSSSLTMLGIWRILSETSVDVRDLDVRHGVVLLSPERAYRADVTVEIK